MEVSAVFYSLLSKQKLGNDVILLEADCIGYGASGRNTGKVSAQHGIVYHELIEKHGKEMAQLYYESHQKSD